jgi:hypothetical protein
LEDVCDWGLRVGPGDCEEGFVPATVGAGFLIAEDEVVEELWCVSFFFVVRLLRLGCGIFGGS